MTVTTTAPLLVPCTTTAAHAFLRPDDCGTCHGTHTRPAAEVEVLFCDNGHELELDTRDPEGPTLDGWAPDEEGPDGVVWVCSWPHCTDTIALTRKGA